MSSLKLLRQRIRENPRERETLCKEANLSWSNLKRKLYNPKKFTLYEIVVFKRVLGLTMDETIKIFAPFVANYN